MILRTRQRLAYALLLALSAATALVLYSIINKPLVLLHRAEVLTKEGRTVEADALIIQAVDAGARHPDSLLRAAKMLFEDGQEEQAVTLLRDALEKMHPVPPGVVGRMAGLLDSHDRSGEALEILLQTNPERLNREERLHLADLLRRRERYAEALIEYDAILRETPTDGQAVLLKAETLAWAGNLDEALGLTRELVRSEPDNRAARLLLARVLYWSGHVDEAEAEYKKLLGEQP